MADAITILRQCGIQPTPQRIAVVECVISSKKHPSADEVYSQAQKNCPTVSRATVYNTLNLLVEKGLIKSQTIKEGAVVFDSNTDNHHHLVCTQCNKIEDFYWPDFDKMNPPSSVSGWGQINVKHVVINGLCSKCKKNI